MTPLESPLYRLSLLSPKHLQRSGRTPLESDSTFGFISMKPYNLLIKYRLYLGIVLILGGVAVNFAASFWPAFPLYFVGLILVLGHFFFGPLRLIQEYLEGGDIEGAEKILNSIKFPRLLYKPIRSVYYTFKRQCRHDETGF